jgi:hypothetical protein
VPSSRKNERKTYEEVASRVIAGETTLGFGRHDDLPPTVRGRPPADPTLKQQMARKLATKAGAAAYALRK